MSEKKTKLMIMELSRERTQLAEKRTRLSYERTMMANIRTAMTMILFGITFIGLSELTTDLFFVTGVFSILIGLLLLIYTFFKSIKHLRDIESITALFETIWFLRDEQDEDL